jgi:hypothetical protein
MNTNKTENGKELTLFYVSCLNTYYARDEKQLETLNAVNPNYPFYAIWAVTMADAYNQYAAMIMEQTRRAETAATSTVQPMADNFNTACENRAIVVADEDKQLIADMVEAEFSYDEAYRNYQVGNCRYDVVDASRATYMQAVTAFGVMAKRVLNLNF